MDYGARAGVMALALAAAGGALGQPREALQLSAGLAVYRDDNVQRQPAAAAVADTYTVGSFGLQLQTPTERQSLVGRLRVDSVRYETFGQYDLDGYDVLGRWNWGMGEPATGWLEYTQRHALASLSSLQDGAQTSVPNALTTRQGVAAGELTFTPRGQLALEAMGREQRNEAAERLVNDLELVRGTLGLYYVGRAGDRLGPRLRAARGVLPNEQAVSGVAVDNSYRQGELALAWDFRPGGATRVSGYLGRVRRDYDELPQRDFEDTSGELALDWTPTGRLQLTALLQRAISDTEEINVSFVFVQRAALGAKYRLGARSELSLALEASDRRYLGEAGQVLGTVAPRTERVAAAGMTAAYRPIARLTLLASLRRETRESEVASYAVGVASLGARIDF